MRGYFMSKYAEDDKVKAMTEMNAAEGKISTNDNGIPKKTLKDRATAISNKAKGFAKGMVKTISEGVQAAGKHIADNKYAYAGGAVGATAGVPVGLALGSLADMTATEKVLTTLLSSGTLAATGAYIGSKYASYKYAADDANPDEKKGQAAWDKVKGGFQEVGGHLNRNKGKYIGGTVGAAAGVPVGAAIAESAGMSPSEKLVTIIATSLATTGAGVTMGHYMDTKA